ncbi:DNA polymerase III subunit gamma and tau, partial [Actinomyces marmotae]
MTTALYRRYRPDAFQDVIGQDHVTAPLMAALRGDRVTHAYLFSGPRGCGKTTSARILARCLNCEQAPTDTPCGVCPSCRDLATGGPGSLDVVEIDAASHNGVDDARDLRERAAFAPARDRYKIFILDEAHMVTPQGFNALLKLVEEPPAHVKFIFATTEPEKVIGTIRSRTHHYPFRLVPPDTLEDYLGQLCRSERVEVGPGVFPLVTRAGGGSVRDTLSVMDQLIGGAIDGAVDYERAVALLGYTDVTLLDSCVDAIAGADGAGVFRVVDRVIASGHDPRRFVEDLLQRLRDLLVIALAGPEAGPALGSLPADQLARMEVQARTVGAAGLSRAADLTAQALGQMVGATSPRLQLELLMARLLIPSQRAGAAEGPTARTGTAGTPGLPGRPSGVGQPGGAPGGAAQAPQAGSGRELAAQIAQRAASAVQGPSAPSAPGAPAAPAVPAQSVAQPAAAQEPEPARPIAIDWEAPAAPGRGAGAPAAPAASAASQAASAPMAPSAAEPSAPIDGWGEAARPGAPSAPSDASHSVAPSAPAAPAGPGAADAEMLRARWEEVLDAAKRSRRATWALVGPNAQPGPISGGTLTLLFSAPGLVGAFDNGGHGPILAAAIHQALGLELQVSAVVAGGDGAGPAGPAGQGGGPSRGPGSPGGPGGPGGPDRASAPRGPRGAQ